MKCQKCFREFEEKDIQLSHDVPKYMGGTDANGRHYLCVKCHDIYEKLGFSIAFNSLNDYQKETARTKVKQFSIKYFGEKK